MISIIIPSLNEGKVLSRTLNGIFSQTYKNVEVILINDASTDTTDEVVKPFLDRIIYIKHEKNLDRQTSRNEGIAVSKGEYIFVCDADIVMQSDCLEKMAGVLEKNPEYSFVYSGFKWEWKVFKSFSFDVQLLRKMNYINTASLVRREHHPGFDVAIRKFQDWDVWLTMIEQGRKGYYIPEVLFSIGENLDRPIQAGLSRWLPQIAYKIPWNRFGIRIAAIEKYKAAQEVMRKKHSLDI